eukprot:gene40062-20965_t
MTQPAPLLGRAANLTVSRESRSEAGAPNVDVRVDSFDKSKQ